ncbi:type IV secretion system DNA-binding domain-containing protein [Thauera mechernichensis]|uniref:Type IV secretion system DNA-binding domain-containing protein n=1 Tax=Thauera mechernichensis TaxID=82788 RepID=A0ABW3WH03_9RHOO|nr:type IV secretion system DNA-binding domain-containing protein [Thauera mechernichensis]MDG3065995.1 type IV secretion system DNA-binding domain-containing protein [Thauera mechernichensis]
MNLVGKETQLAFRVIAVAIASVFVCLYLYLGWPTIADCHAGSVAACGVLVVQRNPRVLSPLADPTSTFVMDWVDGGQYRGTVGENLGPLLDQAFPLVAEMVGVSFAILLAGIVASYLAPRLLFAGGADGKKHLRGAQIVTANRLRRRTKKDQPGGLTVAGIPIPSALEPLSFRFAGSPGSGKSQAISRMVLEFRQRGDAAVIADSGGELMQSLMLKKDLILNPFDARSAKWSPFAEIRGAHDTVRIVKSIIPDAEGQDQQWRIYAQQVLQVTIDRLRASGRAKNGWLTYMCCAAPTDEWANLVQNSPAARWFEPANDRPLGSITGVITTFITPFSYLDPEAGEESFSIARFVESARETGAVLWLPYRADSRAAVATLFSSAIDIATTAVMTLGSDRGRRLFLVLDELAALGKVNALADALAQGRKFGLCAIAGIQTIAQVRALYGKEGATTVLACLQNKIVFSTADSESADLLSRELGESEVAREETSTSGKIGDASSHTKRQARVVEKAVLPSEIQALPPLAGFLKLAGQYPVARIKIDVISFKKRVAAWLPCEDFVTEIRRPESIETKPDQEIEEDGIDERELLAELNGELDEEMSDLDGEERHR